MNSRDTLTLRTKCVCGSNKTQTSESTAKSNQNNQRERDANGVTAKATHTTRQFVLNLTTDINNDHFEAGRNVEKLE